MAAEAKVFGVVSKGERDVELQSDHLLSRNIAEIWTQLEGLGVHDGAILAKEKTCGPDIQTGFKNMCQARCCFSVDEGDPSRWIHKTLLNSTIRREHDWVGHEESGKDGLVPFWDMHDQVGLYTPDLEKAE